MLRPVNQSRLNDTENELSNGGGGRAHDLCGRKVKMDFKSAEPIPVSQDVEPSAKVRLLVARVDRCKSANRNGQ